MLICAPSPDERGFTLIEMLVVLAIMSLVAVAALQQWGARPNVFARAGARGELTQAILAARERAVRHGRVEALEPSNIVAQATLESTLDSDARLMFYPDGSSNGGTIRLGTTPLLEVEWLTGEVHDAPPT